MDDPFLIHIEIAGTKYPLTIERQDEELIREAVRQINLKMLQYRSKFSIEVDTKDLLAMVAFQFSVENLKLGRQKDTSPFTDKIQELTDVLERYLGHHTML